jgi:K+-sensing histidine kinase KdpD
MELQLESFALAPLIANVVKTIEPLAAKNANQVAVQCDAEIGTLHADQMRLRQALLNLMSNANKFTEHGTITVDARQGQEDGRDWVTISVADTGIGADGQAVPGVFPGFLCHSEQIRWHGPWPRHQQTLLSNDGRRHHGRERGGPRLNLYHPPS